MRLFVFPVAPNPTRACLYLAEKAAGGAALPVEQVMVNLREGEQKSPEHLSRNAFGKLPVLELPDGSFLTESVAIIEYLEERFPDPPLLGTDAEARARVRELDRIADLGVLIPIARVVHATQSPIGLPPNPAVAAHAREALPAALGYLDALLADGRPFLAGARPTVADGTLQAAFQFGRFFGAPPDPAYGHVARWDEAYRARDVAKSVLIG